MTKYLIQHGPAKGAKIENAIVDKYCDGVIFSPREETFDSIKSYCTNSFLNKKNTFYDPQFYYVRYDSSLYKNLEKNKFDVSIREKIGVVFDETSFPEYLNLKELSNILKKIYINWEENKYFELLNKFSLDSSKKIKALSKGMKMKLALSVALSHKAKLLILDEATSGLDPVARDDILDLLLEFVQDEENSVLISSHITSDLEKIADYIVFVHEGNTVFEEKKDNLIYEYGLIKCKFNDFEKIEKADILRYRKTDCMYEILVKDKKEMEKKYSSFLMDNVKLEDIMLMYIKGEK